ncbi:protein TIFY 4B isoform X1 [Punica granatum]|uniref:Protein TIFY n=1 Tax=Punica granatum TaxID=22663 RepID=A0A6P8DQN0_PUNGR|nr:protein TIFY 4B isoform X1 [Punica granatum]
MTSVRSILDKPLAQLTEDDISQLTREDCRKFLKDKGMRRPSWNKSQAIQQVISLKALLEGGGDDDSGARATLRKIVVSAAAAEENLPRANSNSGDSGKELSAAANAVESAEEIIPYRRRDPLEPVPPQDAPSSPMEMDKRAASPRSTGAAEEAVGQMTIFYCGQVNVYDGVSPDRARSIMQLAASPVHLPQDDSINGTAPVLSFPCRVHAMNDRLGPSSPVAAIASHATQIEKMTEFSPHYLGRGSLPRDLDVEGQLNRKVLLQRYLEKRKDRGRFKVRKDAGPVSSNLEIYLNHQVKTPISNGQFRKSSSRSSPPQPGVAQGSNLVSLSVDLNEEVQVFKA